MATKKNPLSALLRSDDRQQVQELQRDHVLRSAARQAGTYGVGVQKPLPISQTNLGRLSNSLGTVSGILAQFSAYQSEKEKIELQGQGLQHKLNMQELQSLETDLNIKNAQLQLSSAHETVKQQATKLDQERTAASDAAFDLALANASDFEKEEMMRKADEQVRRAHLAYQAQQLYQEKAHTGDHTDSPLYDRRALRLIGALRADEYAAYLEEKTEEHLASLRDHPNGANLSREEAMDLTDKIRRDFMALKNLSLNDDIGRGFMNATERLRAAKEPEMANRLLKQSEAINTDNLIGAIKQWVDSGSMEDPQSPIESQDWFIQLSGMQSDKMMGAWMGTKGDAKLGIPAQTGLFGLMNTTSDNAVKFQMLTDAVSDKLQMNGKPLEEWSGFDAMQSRIDEAVESKGTEERIKEVNMYKTAFSGMMGSLHVMAAGTTATQRANKAANLVRTTDLEDPEQLRQRLIERFPDSVEFIKQVPEDKLFEFANHVVMELKNIGDANEELTAALVKRAVPNALRMDEQDGLAEWMLEAKADEDEFKGPNTLKMDELYKTFLLGYGDENQGFGLGEQGGARRVGDIDRLSGGVISKYTDDLNNLNKKVQSMLPDDATDDDYNALYKKEFEELKTKTGDKLRSSLRNHIQRRLNVLETLDGNEKARIDKMQKLMKESGYEKLKGALYLDHSKVKTILADNPQLSFEQAIEKAKRHGQITTTLSAQTLNNALSSTPEEAKTLNQAFAQTKGATQAVYDSYVEKGGEYYTQLENTATSLAISGSPWFFDGELKHYNKMKREANKAAEENYSRSVSAGEIVKISEGDYQMRAGNPQPEFAKTPYPVEPLDALDPQFFSTEVGPLLSPGKLMTTTGNLQYPIIQTYNRKTPILLKSGDDFIRTAPKKITKKGGDITLTPSYSTWGNYGSAYGYETKTLSSVEMNSDGEPDIDEDWHRKIVKDITLPPNHFRDIQPPITGIPFGDSEPTQEDVEELVKKLGWSEEGLKDVYSIYGMRDPLSLFKMQYNTSYYYNQRKAKN
jgi:hypothetical protein